MHQFANKINLKYTQFEASPRDVLMETLLFLFGVLLSFSAAFCWGISALLVKISVIKVNFVQSMILRGIYALPVLFILVLIFVALFPDINPFAPIYYPIIIITILSAVALFFGDLFYLISLSKADISFSFPISSSYPFFAAMYLFVLGLEEFTIPIIMGTILVVSGVIAVSKVQSTNTARITNVKGDKKSLAFALSILSAATWGIAVVTLKIILVQNVHPLILNFYRILFILLIAFLFGSSFSRIFPTLHENFALNLNTILKNRTAQITMGLSGITAWAVGGTLFLGAIQIIGANRATPISAITPLVGSLLGFIFLHEKWTRWHLFGLILIILGSLFLISS